MSFSKDGFYLKIFLFSKFTILLRILSALSIDVAL